MGFLDSVSELFKGKRQEQPQASQPSSNLEELKQHESNLSEMMAKGGQDYRNPLDQKALDEVRAKINAIEGTNPTPPENPETPPPGIPQIPLAPKEQEQVEQPKAA